MILVDTSVWVDHFRIGEAKLIELLNANLVLTHSFVIGEIACGSLAYRATTIELLKDMPSVPIAETERILAFLSNVKPFTAKALATSYVHLLASVALAGIKLWTRDKRLQAVAREVGYALNGSKDH